MEKQADSRWTRRRHAIAELEKDSLLFHQELENKSSTNFYEKNLTNSACVL